jgi:hypothetical protein
LPSPEISKIKINKEADIHDDVFFQTPPSLLKRQTLLAERQKEA